MVRTLRRHLSYANVMATLAVFIALGGSSYAVATLSGSHLKNRSVRAVKVARNTLTGREIRESRLGQVPNAARVGGLSASELKIRCPGDTFPFADTCVERNARPPAAYGSAAGVCARMGTPQGPGRRLPTWEELVAAASINGLLAPGGELTSNTLYLSSSPDGVGTLFVVDRVGTVGVTPDTGAGAKAYRCVSDPLN
jgi:hypothetical protein